MECCINTKLNQPDLTNALAHSLRSLGQAYGRISLRSKAAPINLPSMRVVMCTKKMFYLKSNKATDWKKQSLLSRLMKRSTANPDYENVFSEVAEWLIEFGDDQLPEREIGLNSAGVPVLAGPNERNYGFWLDTNMKFSDFENEVIKKAYFEQKWNEFYDDNI